MHMQIHAIDKVIVTTHASIMSSPALWSYTHMHKYHNLCATLGASYYSMMTLCLHDYDSQPHHNYTIVIIHILLYMLMLVLLLLSNSTDSATLHNWMAIQRSLTLYKAQ